MIKSENLRLLVSTMIILMWYLVSIILSQVFDTKLFDTRIEIYMAMIVGTVLYWNLDSNKRQNKMSVVIEDTLKTKITINVESDSEERAKEMGEAVVMLIQADYEDNGVKRNAHISSINNNIEVKRKD